MGDNFSLELRSTPFCECSLKDTRKGLHVVDRRRSSRPVVGKWELLKNNAQTCLSEWDYFGKPVTTSHLFLKQLFSGESECV